MRLSTLRLTSSPESSRAGSSKTERGMYERKRRVCANASASLSTSSSTVPLRVWISLPPNSFFSYCGPNRLTTGGPATNICDVSFTMIE